MEVTVVQQEPVTVVAIQGSIDSLTADQLTQSLAVHVDAGRTAIHQQCWLALIADHAQKLPQAQR